MTSQVRERATVRVSVRVRTPGKGALQLGARVVVGLGPGCYGYRGLIRMHPRVYVTARGAVRGSGKDERAKLEIKGRLTAG